VAVTDETARDPREAGELGEPAGVTAAGRDELASFYEGSYRRGGEDGQARLYADWRALGAQGKADHVIELCSQGGVRARSTLEVGCGDGALLCELGRRGFGGRLHGVEIAQAAVEIAGRHAEIDSVELYDGRHIEGAEETYDLGIVSHVLEHVREPAVLLAEVGRVCGVVVVEVPLEDNLSAGRAGKREHAGEVGHLQRLSRDAARAIVEQAGLEVAGELEDALPLRAQRFFASSLAAKTKATAKWGARNGLHRLAPPLARRLFTVHYACLCLPSRDPSPCGSGKPRSLR
jgi:SAM-dependent methyltransferase